jgi:outer membrane immunogenic protein
MFSRSALLIATAAAAFASQAAFAQSLLGDNTASFRGFRIEGNAGYDWAHSEGNHNSKFGYGGSVGFDGQIGKRIVIGPEFTYWRPNNNRNTVVTPGDIGGTLYHQQRQQLSGDIRVGYLFTPDVLVFGKGGYVNEAQRELFVAPPGETSFYGHGHADGYQYGGGVEFTLHDKFSSIPGGLYVSAQYVRSQFDNHTADDHAMGGIGFRFK